jgi:hypothetical protein
MKLDRSLPYFNTLLKAPAGKRSSILQAFPSFVVDDMVEVLYNVVLGNVNIGSRKQNLKKYKKALLNIVNIKGKKAKRKIIYKQKGGFIGTLLPIILSTLVSNLYKQGNVYLIIIMTSYIPTFRLKILSYCCVVNSKNDCTPEEQKCKKKRNLKKQYWNSVVQSPTFSWIWRNRETAGEPPKQNIEKRCSELVTGSVSI